MSFFARQLKKIEQLALSMLGAKTDSQRDEEIDTEEEEMEDLMALQEEAARVAYLASRERERKEAEELKAIEEAQALKALQRTAKYQAGNE
jgi:hypothetical protein